MDWSEWAQDVGGSILKSAANAKYEQPYEIAKMQMQQRGNDGRYYTEGNSSAPASPAGLTITPGMLMLVGLVVLVVVMQD